MANDSSTRRRLLHALAALACTGIILALILRQVRPATLVEPLMMMTPATLILGAILSMALNVFHAAVTLRWCLRVFGERLSYGAAVNTIACSLAPKMALPALGGIARAVYVHRAHGVDLAAATAAVVLSPWLKMAWLVLLSLAGWAAGAQMGLSIVAALAAGLLALVATAWAAPRGGAALLDRAAMRWKKLDRLQKAIAPLRRGVRFGPLLAASVHALISVLLELGLFGLILHALGGDLQLPTLVAYFPLCAIGSKVPVAVLGLGVRETLVLLFLAPLAAPPILLATSLIHSILAFILPPLLMSLFTWKLASRILR